MKKIGISLLFMLCTGVYAEKVTVSIPGMVCQMCLQGMQKAFKDSVENPAKDIAIDLDKKLLHLNLKASLSDDDIKSRVASAGYNVNTIERITAKKKAS